LIKKIFSGYTRYDLTEHGRENFAQSGETTNFWEKNVDLSELQRKPDCKQIGSFFEQKLAKRLFVGQIIRGSRCCGFIV
jgi:hypothetical protein